MKTTFNSGLIAFVFTLFMLSATTSKAQCPQDWFVQNDLSCNIIIDVFVVDYDPFSVCPPLNAANACHSLTGVSVPQGQNYTIGCGSCTNVCDIMVIITQIGATGTSDIATFNISGNPTQCGASSFSYNGTDTFTIQ